MKDDTLSINVILGYVGQVSLEHGIRDEIDAMRGLLRVDRPLELVLVDRSWPARWGRIVEVFGSIIDKVRYVPVRPKDVVDRGMYVVSGAMNSGIVCSSGGLILSSGDFSAFRPQEIRVMYDEWFERKKLIAPLIDGSWAVHQRPGRRVLSQGLNVGPRLYPRNVIRAIGGWEEAFDGSRGREDEAIDLCLDLYLKRVLDGGRWRDPRVIIHKVRHKNGQVEIVYKPPWDLPEKPPRIWLRCNLSFSQRVIYPRLDRGEWRTNLPVGEEDIARMSHKCDTSLLHRDVNSIPAEILRRANGVVCCCERADRAKQLDSYRSFDPPNVARLQDAFEDCLGKEYGCIDPWKQVS